MRRGPAERPTGAPSWARCETSTERGPPASTAQPAGGARSIPPAGPLGLLFRGLARIHLLHAFIDHQRLVNTFVSNVWGAAGSRTFAGRVITRLVPMTINPGNVGAAFVALSYAGELTVTAVSDPELSIDSAALASRLRDELVMLTTVGRAMTSTSTRNPADRHRSPVPIRKEYR